jgi:hypothetical protein
VASPSGTATATAARVISTGIARAYLIGVA